MSTEKGKKAEELACRYLQRHGYEIIARNCRLGRGELDIVAKQGQILVFVEVKAHQQRETSLLAMHDDKCARFISAANSWLGINQTYAALQSRFDLIMVTPRKSLFSKHNIEHLEDIIRL